ncbi:hypothetical protein C7Y71_005195 [Pseudoprevotella muciniphila]|uniref:Uncharacterized protein n=1 Tax=Pseudoprevotella muciniphila TaxID=2133944 RepID=A0A5P8E5Z2_9BACT|nr:hypothetical protein C7Y71_005195 [Pseudoprevotella muciniphila]
MMLNDWSLKGILYIEVFLFMISLAAFWFFWASFDLTSWNIARYAPANLNQNLHQNNSKIIQA